MHAHTPEPPERRTEPTSADAHRAAVKAVGTFAAGQSPEGSFHVAADAELGTFASGLAEGDEASDE